MRFYLDYNSTHPLLDSIPTKLASLTDANPSSQHQAGKSALKSVHQVESFLKDYFSWSGDILFHSGATEFFNTIFRDCFLVYQQSDHAAIHEIAKVVPSLMLKNLAGAINKIKEVEADNIWFNFQWMNNETGEVISLEEAVKIKKETGCKVHVDAVQTIGKIVDFQKLSSELDCYTYSGHKFGSLKGIGFSLLNNTEVSPLILGGGQQNGLRAGTLNTHGINSLQWALEDHDYVSEMNSLSAFKQKIEVLVDKFDKLERIQNDSVNTVCILHESMKSDKLLVHFDLAGLEVSSGSACSSGSFKPSETLLAKDFEEKATQSIRISLGRDNLQHEKEILDSLESVFSKL